MSGSGEESERDRQVEDETGGERSGVEQDLERTIEQRARRRLVAERAPRETVWFGVGMFGLVGWAVTIPTLLGLGLGLWLDRVTESDRSWTLACLAAGVGVGGLNASYWVRRELQR